MQGKFWHAIESRFLVCSSPIFYYYFIFTQDMFQLLTPGGGGYGRPDENNCDDTYTGPPEKKARHIQRGSVFEFTKAQESV